MGVAGLIGFALLSVPAPPMEGWWPPEGPDPHPSGLVEDVRLRVSEATLQLGDHATGVLVSRDGLVLTSAAALADCAARLGVDQDPEGFLASEATTAPVCPNLNAYVHVEVQDVSRAVRAAARAGSDARPALVSACTRRRRGRRCRVVTGEDNRARLVIERELAPVRLRFLPRPRLRGLGRRDHARSRPRLRLDAGLVSVGAQRHRTAALVVRTSMPTSGELLWVAHHPRPSLRWRSALEVEVFVETILPTYRRRAAASARPSSDERTLETLAALGSEALTEARKRELSVLARAAEASTALAQAFHRGRATFRVLPWERWAARTAGGVTGPPLLGSWADGLPPLPRGEDGDVTPPPKYGETLAEAEYAQGHAARATALIGLPGGPTGPDGQGDLRLSRGTAPAARTFATWAQTLAAAERLNRALALPRPLPWSPREEIGFELAVDIGPRATGGPVVDERGRLLGIISGGDTQTLAGLFRFVPEATASAVPTQAVLRALMLRPDGRALAEELRR